MDRDQSILDYLQDRLSSADRQAFEKVMAQDGAVAAEVKLMRAVRADLSAAPEHEEADAVWERISDEIDATSHAANDNRRPLQQVLKYAAVAVIAVAASQIILGPRVGQGPDGFRTASQNPAAFTFQAKFVETATLAEIAALLAPLDGTISDGPSALGLVRLSFTGADQRDAAMQALQESNALVEFVAE